MSGTPEPPRAVREIVRAAVDNALARCDRLGLAREDFYRALVEGRKAPGVGGPAGLADLLERTFRRLARAAN